MSLEAYRKRVEKLARERDGEPIFNGSLDHAAIIVETMFAHARDSISILSGKMNARVYGREEVLEQARLFLVDPTHKARILLDDSDPSSLKEHPFFKEFGDNENLEVKFVREDFRAEYDFHFLVMDGDSYRFDEDKTKHAAIAAFGDKKGAENIGDLFDILWKLGHPVDSPKLASS